MSPETPNTLGLPPIRSPLTEAPKDGGKPTAYKDYYLFWERMARQLSQTQKDVSDLTTEVHDLENTVDQLIEAGTHAQRLTVAAASIPVDSLWIETDRYNIVYQVQSVAGVPAWVFVTGAMYGTVIATDQRPTGLGVNDTGLIFLSTDSVSVRWDGANWKQLNRIIDAGDFATNPRSQTVWQALGAGAVSVQCVSSGNENLSLGAFYDAGWKAADTAIVILSHEANAFNLKGSAGNTIGAAPAETLRLTVDLATGNVGIGISNPSCRLSLGAVIVDRVLAVYDSPPDHFYGFGMAGSTLRHIAGGNSPGNHSFFVGATEVMRLTSAGQIMMLLGGTLRTLSVDGSGFVKAT